MELNAETVKKALDWLDSLVGNSNDSDMAMLTYQLLGILYDTCEELTEENEMLRAENENKCKDCAGCLQWKCDCANIEDYTVEKYKSAIVKYYSKPTYQPTKEHPIKHTQIEHLFVVLDQIAKEMLEGKDEKG
jgi:hypothetical protein